jgi:hypothetical protein
VNPPPDCAFTVALTAEKDNLPTVDGGSMRRSVHFACRWRYTASVGLGS